MVTKDGTTGAAASPVSAAEVAAPAEAGGLGFSHRQIMVTMSGLVIAMLLAMLDNMIVAPALPTIVGELGGLNHLAWVTTGYILASTVVHADLGQARRPVRPPDHLHLAAIVMFLVGSALCGMSQNMARADRLPRDPGPRRRRPDGRRHVDHRRDDPAARPQQVPGRDDGRHAGRHDRRPADRRLHHRQPRLALGLLRQPAARRGRAGGLLDHPRQAAEAAPARRASTGSAPPCSPSGSPRWS